MEKQQVVHIHPYIKSFDILGRRYDVHNWYDENRGDCERCDGIGVIYKFRHRDNGKCYACQGTGGEHTPFRAVRDIIVVPPSLADSNNPNPSSGLMAEKRRDTWKDVFPDSGSGELIEAVLTKDYKVFTKDQIEDIFCNGPLYDKIWTRFFDWKKAMIREINEMEKKGQFDLRRSA